MHIVYETTNKVNGKTYIGIHEQNGSEFDGYVGSGVVLEQAITKHGKENFERRTLVICPSREYAREIERRLVTEEYVACSDTYNATVGGNDPPSHLGVAKTPEHRQKIGLANKGNKRPDLALYNKEHKAREMKGNSLVKNTFWVNNGSIEARLFSGDLIPEQFIRGRLKRVG